MTWQRVFNNPVDLRYKTRAAFMLPGRRNWSWVTWVEKARELGAVRWDFGNADHYSMADYPGGTFG